jgi:hypothetical protein
VAVAAREDNLLDDDEMPVFDDVGVDNGELNTVDEDDVVARDVEMVEIRWVGKTKA